MRWLQALRDGAPLPPWVLVVAHPDDEIVGAGSLLRAWPPLALVGLTDGAPVDGRDAAVHGLDVAAYREARRAERLEALAQCGIGPDRVVDLGCPDQQAACRLPALAVHLARLLHRMGPVTVLTHPYEGGHPDHDAAAFAVQAACALLRRDRQRLPEVAEMACYHQGARGLASGGFLPDAAADAQRIDRPLDPRQHADKQTLLACHRTQAATLRWLRDDREGFRPAPAYDFLRPPSAEPAWYERFGWGITAQGFCERAGQAVRALGLEAPPWA